MDWLSHRHFDHRPCFVNHTPIPTPEAGGGPFRNRATTHITQLTTQYHGDSQITPCILRSFVLLHPRMGRKECCYVPHRLSDETLTCLLQCFTDERGQELPCGAVGDRQFGLCPAQHATRTTQGSAHLCKIRIVRAQNGATEKAEVDEVEATLWEREREISLISRTRYETCAR